MGLIKLDYGVLAMLAQSNLSGYDITNKINYFWKTTHSRVYPVLSKLEKLGYVEHVLIEQRNKPDKKLYHITPVGEEILRQWVTVPTQPSVKKDESLLKVFCVHLLEHDVIINLLEERIKFVEKEAAFIKKAAENTKEQCGGQVVDTSSQTFGLHILSQGLLSHANLELEWCRWAIELYKRKTSDNFLDITFKPFKEPKIRD